MKYTQAFNYRVNIHLYKPSILVNEASVKPINNFCRLETELNLKQTLTCNLALSNKFHPTSRRLET